MITSLDIQDGELVRQLPVGVKHFALLSENKEQNVCHSVQLKYSSSRKLLESAIPPAKAQSSESWPFRP
jgi:hypothetical protein